MSGYLNESYTLPNKDNIVTDVNGENDNNCKLNYYEAEITLETNLYPTELFYKYWPKEDYPCLHYIFYKFLEINQLDLNNLIDAKITVKFLFPVPHITLKEYKVVGTYDTNLTVIDQKRIVINEISTNLSLLKDAYDTAIVQLKNVLEKETLEFIPDFYDIFLDNLLDSLFKTLTLTFKSSISSDKRIKFIVDIVYGVIKSTRTKIKQMEGRNLKKISKNEDLDFLSESTDIVKDIRKEMQDVLENQVISDTDWTKEKYIGWKKYLNNIKESAIDYSNLIDLDITLNYIITNDGYCDFVFDSEKKLIISNNSYKYIIDFISIGNTGHNHALSEHLNKLFFRSGTVKNLWEVYYKNKIKTEKMEHIPLYILNIPVRIRFLDDYLMPIIFDSDKNLIQTIVKTGYPYRKSRLTFDSHGNNYYLDNHFHLESDKYFLYNEFRCPLPIPYKFDIIKTYNE